MSANRIVAMLTPVAALLAGITADWLAKHAPGVKVEAAAFEEIFVGGLAAVVAPAIVWMLGWQKHEAREAAAAERAEAADLALGTPPAAADDVDLDLHDDLDPDLDLDLDLDIDDGLADEADLEDENDLEDDGELSLTGRPPAAQPQR